MPRSTLHRLLLARMGRQMSHRTIKKKPTSWQGQKIERNASQTMGLKTGTALLLAMRFLSVRL